MSVSFGKFQDSSDSRQSAKLNLASFKLKTTPFGVNLPKKLYMVWSKVHRSQWKNSLCLQVELEQDPSEHNAAIVLLPGTPLGCSISPQPCTLLCSWQQQPLKAGSFPLFYTISQAVPQTVMPVDISQSYFNKGNMWRCFASILLCNAEVSGSLAIMLQKYSSLCNKLL